MATSDIDKEAPISKVRHTLAHVLAHVVKDMYPHARFATGPVTEHGFYYDFDFSGGEAPGEADLPKIEKSMRKIIKKGFEPKSETVTLREALERFTDAPYKTEILTQKGEQSDEISLYTISEFVDPCSGPHVASSKEIDPASFKLERIAGAYWKGDEHNPMLCRIYGVAFESKEALEAYEKRQEEARKRDHRKLGKELDLFTFSDLVGPGLPLYTPRGQLMREAVTDLLWDISRKYGYQKVAIPHITKLDLYERSGHAEKFKDEFFYVHGAQSGDDFVLKPMNCPHHTQIYASTPRSYKTLPVRMSEVTHMYRDEKPGELIGLGRTRAIAVDDAHIFCTPEQIKQEAINIVKIIQEFYSAFGLWNKGETFWVSLSVRDPKTPEKYLGTDENWERAEQYLKEVSDELELDATRIEGEAAFYGPKLDFMFTDALGRERQLSTVQVDFVMPERFALTYTAEDGEKKTPVMIHRAIAGSLERFMAIMIEHFAGAFPLWLSPEQVRVLTVSEAHLEYAAEIKEKLARANIRVELDESNETLGKKIRNAKTQKVPYFLVIGDKEVESETVTLESRDGTSTQLSADALIEKLEGEIRERTI